jgi:hypothetical protein
MLHDGDNLISLLQRGKRLAREQKLDEALTVAEQLLRARLRSVPARLCCTFDRALGILPDGSSG